jgi:hypothetical protein
VNGVRRLAIDWESRKHEPQRPIVRPLGSGQDLVEAFVTVAEVHITEWERAQVSTSRTRTRPTKRTGVAKFLGNIVDDTKEFVDDVLDRTRDAEKDLRDAARRALRYDDDDEQEQDIEALKEELDQLTEKIAALSSAQPEQSRPREQG